MNLRVDMQFGRSIARTLLTAWSQDWSALEKSWMQCYCWLRQGITKPIGFFLIVHIFFFLSETRSRVLVQESLDSADAEPLLSDPYGESRDGSTQRRPSDRLAGMFRVGHLHRLFEKFNGHHPLLQSLEIGFRRMCSTQTLSAAELRYVVWWHPVLPC